MDIRDKIIVITGGSSGIGKDLCGALADGNTVVALSRSLPDSDKSFSVDVSDGKRVAEVFDKIGAKFGRIDILINCAGYGMSGVTEYIPCDAAEKITAVNYLGVLFCSQSALKYMSAGAKIINIGSLSGVSPMPFRALYNSSKAAVHMLSYSMNLETKPLGISVAAIKLGDVDTGFKDHREIFADGGRYGQTAARVDAFVASRPDGKKLDRAAAIKKIINVVKKDRLKSSYILGAKYKLANALQVFAPELVMRIVYRVMTQPKPKR
ncbi:MAG: SDR family NAD(P)-dependent oxidoreductase [Clostridiales bacterium]|jgi:NAD(P)-dependent dehydrogenase (short-subunit alcohol dehydrogenase family)|nr:SDR family NAD(P)-dependent oxidoreductase [Clostridiales bacterium]